MILAQHLSRRAAFVSAIISVFIASSRAAEEKSSAKETEAKLIDVLRSSSAPDMAIACKKLAIFGSKDAVPELAPLLANKELASWARIALEAIPDPAADEALRKASDSLKGRLLVGTINSIGVRRDAQAVDRLIGRLTDADQDVASAAAVALGRIGNSAATKALRQTLPTSANEVRNAVAEGCILCAERLTKDGKSAEAAEIYDEVRKTDVPKQKKLEAIRGAILARNVEGIPLLVEQLESQDKAFLNIGLATARELPGREVGEALAGELSKTTPERSALLLHALADRNERPIPAPVLAAAKSGAKPVRIAAIGLIGRLGDAGSLSTLLDVAGDSDEELSQAAKSSLVALPGWDVVGAIAARLEMADSKALPVLLAVAGQKRIEATGTFVKLLDNSDAAIRRAALAALGETVGPRQLNVLIVEVVAPKHSDDAETAEKALRAACVRMPDREACAAELAAALPRASAATKVKLMEILGAVGGTKSLETIAAAIKGNDPDLQDTGSRVLGEWMSVDAGPALLDLSKTASSEKLQSRAMRGYIRLARQFAMPDRQRAEMCEAALDATSRPPEQKLVLAVLERYPSADTLRVAAKAARTPALKQDAGHVAMAIAQKLNGNSPEVQKLLTEIGVEPLNIEIIKAEYGAGSTQKDVTDVLKKHVNGLPLINFSTTSYNEIFGGDPVPNTPKQLKVQYRINGKPGEVTLNENATILLPMPK
jgi:HEAT repeat protein